MLDLATIVSVKKDGYVVYGPDVEVNEKTVGWYLKFNTGFQEKMGLLKYNGRPVSKYGRRTDFIGNRTVRNALENSHYTRRV